MQLKTPDKEVEEIDISIANLLFAGLSISQIKKIPKWLLENIENNKDTFRTTLTQYHQDITNEAMSREKQLKQIHTIELDAVSCMSIEQFVMWRDQRKQRPTIK